MAAIHDEIQRVVSSVVDAVMYSAAVDESILRVCFCDDQATMQSPIVMMKPVVLNAPHCMSLCDASVHPMRLATLGFFNVMPSAFVPVRLCTMCSTAP